MTVMILYLHRATQSHFLQACSNALVHIANHAGMSSNIFICEDHCVSIAYFENALYLTFMA